MTYRQLFRPFAGPGVIFAVLLSASASAQTLVARYDLNEEAGTTFLDTSGNNQGGSWINAPTIAQAGARPTTGMSTAFDVLGNTRGDITSSPQLDALDSDLTIAAWVYREPGSQVRRIFGNDGSWAFGMSGENLRFTTRTIRDYDLGATVPVGQWSHVAAVMDANFDVTFYVNGVTVGVVTGTAPANQPFSVWHVGALRVDFEIWPGNIDDIQVYDGSLTAAQVGSLYMNPGSTVTDLGTRYCDGGVNSTGTPAVLFAGGSDRVTDNAFRLTARGVPSHSFGMLLASQTQGSTMIVGSQTIMCLSGAISPFQQHVMNSGPLNLIDVPVDLTAFPVLGGGGSFAVASGESWSFQYWFRDQNPGVTSNMTSAVEVVFQ